MTQLYVWRIQAVYNDKVWNDKSMDDALFSQHWGNTINSENFHQSEETCIRDLDRFQIENINSATTPIEPNLKLAKEHVEKKVNSTLYKQMFGAWCTYWLQSLVLCML